MAIDFNTNASGTLRSNQSTATAAKPAVSAERAPADARQAAAGDAQVKLSSQAQHLQTIEDRLGDLPDVDSARVEQLRQAIADGSYQPDNGRLADKLIALES